MGLSGLLLIVIAALVWVRVFHHYPPAELMRDLRAGIAVKDIKDPAERFHQYFEKRYGPMSDPANGRAAFLDFFNTGHIRALELLVKGSPADSRQPEIQATADWIANYRASMSAEERGVLREEFGSDAGRAMLRQATAQYNSQDVYYRGSTAVVISELLTTIREIQKSP